MSRHYQYDEAGNITQIQSDLGQTDYGYDKLSRLTQATPDQNLQSLGLPQEHYSYDPVHNRTSSAHQPGAWSYNADNQLTQYPHLQPFSPGASPTDTAVSYTPQGHTQRESNSQWTKDYHYSAAERLIRYSQTDQGQSSPRIEAHYQYDPFGRRIAKSVKQAGATRTVYFIYSEQGLMAEADEAGKLTRAYGFNPVAAQQGLWSTDPIWQANVSNGSLTDTSTRYHYLHTDHLGTPQLATTQDGQTSWKAASEAFGAVAVLPQSSIEMNLRFPGQYFDQETNSHYNFHRDYKPNLGRYLQSDPIGLKGGMNLFSYAEGNAVNLRDVIGLSSSGKCCDPQYSDQECCAVAKSGGQVIVEGRLVDGTVVCCQGRKVACISNETSQMNVRGRIAAKCTMEHEEFHFQHVSCPDDCSVFISRFRVDLDPKKGECEAYSVEINCLRRSRADCQGDRSCEIYIDAIISSKLNTAKMKYNCGEL